MDGSKDSPAAPAGDAAPSKHAPLAPSQELAYRKKCIALKRRLQDIESNNDATRRRIELEKQHVQKMRLNRAILLNHLKDVMDAPAKRLSDEELQELGIARAGSAHLAELISNGVNPTRPDGEGLLDDSSEGSEEEPEPAERPERRRRTNHYQNSTTTAADPPAPNPSAYQPGLQNIAPAAYNGPGIRDPSVLASQFPVAVHPGPASTPQQPWQFAQQQMPADSSFVRASPINSGVPNSLNNPIQIDGSVPAGSPVAPTLPRSASTAQLPPEPSRPNVPFDQFTEHMKPQLEADNYPTDQIDARIQQEWDGLSAENRGLWDRRYQDQMREFTAAMDEFKRLRARAGKPSGSFSESRNRSSADGMR